MPATTKLRWAELAIEAGYADQSHMINECLSLAGASPTALRDAAEESPADMSVSSKTGEGDLP
ncbi:MAG TPA: hypothetical protein VMU34_25000 [Mycobacterium sp.]|nr:hypothetical protein [Mycobacterium sp.]